MHPYIAHLSQVESGRDLNLSMAANRGLGRFGLIEKAR
jgi:hypothetical protein